MAMDFFGIEYNGNTADNIMNMIYSLSQNDVQQAGRYYKQLEKTSPALAKKINIDELKVPCTNCSGKGLLEDSAQCPDCRGSGLIVDAQALAYLQYKFSSAIDSGKSERWAWKTTKSSFDQRRKAALSYEALSGTIIRIDGTGVLLTLEGNDEVVYLKNMGTTSLQEGAPLSGMVWPSGTYTYHPDDGNPREIKCYTATLWAE